MNTTEQQIALVVADPPMLSHGARSKSKEPKVLIPGKWQEYFAVPSGWNVVCTSIEKLTKQKRTPPVTVIWEPKWNSSRGEIFANTMAKMQRHRVNDGFVLFSYDKCGHVDIGEHKNLLNYFACPERVEFAYTRKGIAATLQEVVAKWEVLQQKASDRPVGSTLDDLKEVMAITQDLREDGGKLSAKKVAKLFGLSLRGIAQLLNKTPQALSKTPTTDTIQVELGFFERISRLRLVLKSNASFRKWLNMGNAALGGKQPMEFLQNRKWQALADFVDDILTGAPT